MGMGESRNPPKTPTQAQARAPFEHAKQDEPCVARKTRLLQLSVHGAKAQAKPPARAPPPHAVPPLAPPRPHTRTQLSLPHTLTTPHNPSQPLNPLLPSPTTQALRSWEAATPCCSAALSLPSICNFYRKPLSFLLFLRAPNTTDKSCSTPEFQLEIRLERLSVAPSMSY